MRTGRFSKTAGFSFLELIVVVAVLALIASVGLVNLIGTRNRNQFDSTTKKVVALLREAQSRSATLSMGQTWGVAFENSTNTPASYALFYSPYGSSTVVEHYPLPNGVIYATSSLSEGASKEILFSPIAGLPTTPTSVVLLWISGGRVAASSAITVTNSGLVGY